MSDKICFVIAPIGESTSETRKRSDQVLKHVIRPATEDCGYQAIRADEISEPGLITSQIIQHLVDDPMVVADLTERNPNVFYELALRHAIRLPLVQIIKKGENIPFDVAGMRTIQIDHHDLDSVEEAKQEIISQIKSVEDKTPEQIESPISTSLQLLQLQQSDNPEQRTLADLWSVISEMRTGIFAIENRLVNQEALLLPDLTETIAQDNRAEDLKYIAIIKDVFDNQIEYLNKYLSSENINKDENELIVQAFKNVSSLLTQF